jgi:P4 family phage/plasmid primase-like protien
MEPYGSRFIKVAKNGKNAVDKDWPDNLLSLEQLTPWLSEGGNYGVVAGQSLIIIDLDCPQHKADLPDTLTVETGRGGLHLYYRSDACDNGVLEQGGKNIGHIQVKRKYVVGPGSTHPNGNRYRLQKAVPIAWISKPKLEEAFGSLLRWAGVEKHFPQAELEHGESGISICDVAPIQGLQRRGEEYQGPHPLHGSTTGQNFCANAGKNVWYCFRHETGGGPLSWIAVQEGIIQCGEALPGALRGETYKRVLQIAKEKYGYKILGDFGRETSREFFGRDGRFQPVMFARHLMTKHTFKTSCGDKTMFVYNPTTGIYTPTGQTIIQQEMTRLLGDDVRKRHYQDVEFYIQGQTFFDRPEIASDKVAVLNGLLNVETGMLTDFTPDEFITIQLTVAYNPTAECPKILTFLEQVVGRDQLPLVQEILGYCLLQKYPIHKAVLLVGDGANGKSTMQELFKRFLGSDNVTSVSLQALCENRFAVASLFGKLANLCADIPDKPLTRTGTFKMLVGNDTLMAEEKFKSIFSFKNHAKLIFSCNTVPETADQTNAFFRRWIIITCPNTFTGDKCDPAILDKIAAPTEMSWLLNWALKGLARLLGKGDFSNTATFQGLREQYVKASNPAQAFIETCLDPDDDREAIILKDDLYNAYVDYCNSNKLKSVQKNVFSQKLAQFMPSARPAQKRIDGGKRVHAWQYLKFKANATCDMDKEGCQTKPETSPNQQEDRENWSVVSVTGVTGSLLYGRKLKKCILNEQPVTPVTEGSDGPSEPCFLWHRVAAAEPCELCGQLAVEFEINHIAERQILRRCEPCFSRMRALFSLAVWRRSGAEADSDG